MAATQQTAIERALQSRDDSLFKPLTGVELDVFDWADRRFASDVVQRSLFAAALTFLKIYPIGVAVKALCGYSARRLWSVILVVGERADEYFTRNGPNWLRRVANRVTSLGNTVVGLVDTFPIFINRPSRPGGASVTYQPKYAAPVLKIQVVTNLKGVPVHWAGPFLGVMADIDVFRESNAIGALSLDPDVEARYKLLGDKAYVKDEAKWPVITPAKANSREMKADSEAADAKATVVNWYRSTVEHTFAYLKRYAFLNSQLRLRNVLDKKTERRIRAAVALIIALAFHTIRASPLKDLVEMEVEGARVGLAPVLSDKSENEDEDHEDGEDGGDSDDDGDGAVAGAGVGAGAGDGAGGDGDGDVALPPSPRMAFFGDPELVRRQHLRQTIERDKKRVAEKTAAAAYEELNRRRRAKKSRTSRAPSQSRFGRHSAADDQAAFDQADIFNAEQESLALAASQMESASGSGSASSGSGSGSGSGGSGWCVASCPSACDGGDRCEGRAAAPAATAAASASSASSLPPPRRSKRAPKPRR